MKKPEPRRGRVSSIMLWTLGIFAALLLLLFLAPLFLGEPLRRYMERGMNETLDGYSVRLGEVDLHPFGAAVTVRDLVLRQEAHPEPAVASFPVIVASIHWRELLTGNLVSDWHLKEPKLHVNLRQLRAEAEDESPVEKRGWQEAIKHIYPFEINLLQIDDGSMTYIDQDPERPLVISRVNLTAGNIRNIHSPRETYPSPFRLEADILEKGHGLVEGKANFLAEPHLGLEARIRMREVPLGRLLPVTSRANFHLTGGILAGEGHLEYSPQVKRATLENLAIDGLKLDYVHTQATADAEKRRAQKAKKKLEKAPESEWRFKADNLHLSRGAFGFVNETRTPSYRVSLDAIDLQVSNLSNRFRTGEAEARLEGQFMQSGNTFVRATFRPIREGVDFDLLVAIEGTSVPKMNDLLRAHTGMDVVAGTFSFYSQIGVKGRQINGYAKPFFTELDIYDPRQEKGKGLIDKIKEGLADVLAQILENPEDKLATQFDLSGTVEDPEASTWQIILQLIRNGFFDAILPGFENLSEGNRE